MPHAADKDRTIDQFRDLLRIDKYALDDDFVEQPDLLFQVSEQHALAVSRRDAAKLEMETGMAALAQQIRSQAAESKEKMTETSLQEQLADHDKAIRLKKDYAAAIRSAAEWGALVEGFRDRSSALKGLTQLYASNYFSTSTGSAPRSAAVDKVADQVRERVLESRRERGGVQRQRSSRD